MVEKVKEEVQAIVPDVTPTVKPRGKWTRKRKTQAGSRTIAALFQGETRSKAIGTVIAGIILTVLLTMCKSSRLTQALHIINKLPQISQ